jgi:hypothetical protein
MLNGDEYSTVTQNFNFYYRRGYMILYDVVLLHTFADGSKNGKTSI